uniref:pentatricopeptide repeat-containing protein At1g55890, mitochondrial-like n=1 Tax=Erigeron canadensis TaxID=72917 RepID=UPI001CB9D152|nr:pentatricopeptide repeat-containing protein At1g55890, mitochondrial-like [Erigeron canadensis]
MAFEPLPMSQLTDSLKNLKMFIDTFKRSSNVGPFRYNYKIYNDVVSHLAKSRQHAYIEEILEHQKRYKTEMTHESFVARLISLYGKARMFDHARKVFDEMPELNCPRTVLSANALLNACINSKKVDKMPELFRELKEVVGIEPDEVSYNVMIKALCEMEDCDFALKMIDEMEMNGCECSLYTYNTIIVALYAKGLVSDGDKLWEVMRGKNIEPDVWTYNAKVRGLIVDKRIDEAVQLINEMKGNGVTPDVYTYNGLIHGFVKEDDLVGVKKWYAEMVENKIVPDLVTFRIIINFASKRADYRYAYELSRTSLLRELNVSRSSLQGVVDGLVKESAIDEAKELVELVNKQSNLLYYKLKLSVN